MIAVNTRCGLSALVRIVVISVLLGAPLFAADVILRGRVIDENGAPVRGASVTVRPRTGAIVAPPEGLWEAQTDPDGIFAFTLPGPADIVISVEREEYYALKEQALHLESLQELTLTINSVREVFQSTNVNAETSPG
jgi:hypothetical protein